MSIRPERVRSKPFMEIIFWLCAMAFCAFTTFALVQLFYFDLESWSGWLMAALVTIMASAINLFICSFFFRLRGHNNDFGCVSVLVILFIAEMIAIPAAFLVSDANNKMHSARRLREIAIAMHEYEKTNGHLPPAVLTGKDGQASLSWRVLILPFLGEKEQELYRTFHLDEPWDSPHNQSLLAAMPEVYAPPRGFHCEPYTTCCKVFVGKGAVFEPDVNLTLSQIKNGDGLSNTILVAAAGTPVPWTKPEDLTFTENQLPLLMGDLTRVVTQHNYHRFRVAMADGTIRYCPQPHDANAVRNLRAMITWNGGETVDTDIFE